MNSIKEDFMKRARVAIAAFSMAFIAFGCTKAQEAALVPPADENKGVSEQPVSEPDKKKEDDKTPPAPSTAWKLHFSSTCEELAPEKCLGFYGLTLQSDGNFQIGPAGADGRTFHGSLEPSELQTLSESLAATLNGISTTVEDKELCGALEAEAKNSDSVEFNKEGYQKTLLRSSKAEFCFRMSSGDDAKKLHKAIRALASKYYKLPLPSDCAVQAYELEGTYPGLQTCASDDECTYVDNMFDTVAFDPQRPGAYIFINDCSQLRPLQVANKGLLTESAKEKLQAKRSAVRSACGPSVCAPGLPLGFDSASAAPKCEAGFCRVSNQVTILR
jgi:hypothetical protein